MARTIHRRRPSHAYPRHHHPVVDPVRSSLRQRSFQGPTAWGSCSARGAATSLSTTTSSPTTIAETRDQDERRHRRCGRPRQHVIYNFGDAAGEVTDDYGKVQINYVGKLPERRDRQWLLLCPRLHHDDEEGGFGVLSRGMCGSREWNKGGCSYLRPSFR